MPLQNNKDLRELFRTNAGSIFGGETFCDYPHSGGSTDAGDLSQIMPVLHPSMSGASGTIHGPDWFIADSSAGYLSPAKTLAMMAIDLLAGDAATARQIIDDNKPGMSREGYLKLQKEIFHREVFDGASGTN